MARQTSAIITMRLIIRLPISLWLAAASPCCPARPSPFAMIYCGLRLLTPSKDFWFNKVRLLSVTARRPSRTFSRLKKWCKNFPETDFVIYTRFMTGWWFGTIAFVHDYELNYQNSPAPLLDFRFSKFYLPPNDYHLWSGMDEYERFEMSPDSSMYLSLQDCNFHGGRINLGNPDHNYYDPSQVYACRRAVVDK